jgi:hypothetical protein
VCGGFTPLFSKTTSPGGVESPHPKICRPLKRAQILINYRQPSPEGLGYFQSSADADDSSLRRPVRGDIKNSMATNPKSIEGIYKHGKVELLETPDDVDEARVIVTFIPENSVDLSKRGIDESQAANLRARLQTFAEDWERPEMGAYDAL